MANTYTKTRLEPSVLTAAVGSETKDNVIVSLTIGVSAVSEDGYAAYKDEKVMLPAPNQATFIEFRELCGDPDLKWANEIADRHINENNWFDVLDKLIEAKRAEPLTRRFVWNEQEGPSV